MLQIRAPFGAPTGIRRSGVAAYPLHTLTQTSSPYILPAEHSLSLSTAVNLEANFGEEKPEGVKGQAFFVLRLFTPRHRSLAPQQSHTVFGRQ